MPKKAIPLVNVSANDNEPLTCRCTRGDSHHDVLVGIGRKEFFCHDFSVDSSMGNGVVGADAFGPVDVKGSNSRMLGDFQKVCLEHCGWCLRKSLETNDCGR